MESNLISNLIFNLIGGLGLFLFGMKLMSEALQVLAGDRLRRIISAVTDNRILGVGTGLLVTMVVQSSSVTTVMVVSFVNAGLMNLMQAASVILGANIGTTITGWILVLPIHKPALLLLGVGAFLHLFGRRESARFSGQMLMGFGMIFFGLSLMKAGFAPLKEHPYFVELLARFGAEGVYNILMSVAVGAALTMLLQSSSVVLGITIALATVGLVDFRGAVALGIGGNIGTTITAQLAALSGTTAGRRAAMFHTLVNVVGAVVMVAMFDWWVTGVDIFMPGDPNLTTDTGARPYMTPHIASAHTSFNIVIVMIVLPMLRQAVNLTQTLVRGKEDDETSLQFLHTGLARSPALAIEQGRLEVFRMAAIGDDMLKLTREMYEDFGHSQSDLKERIFEAEEVTDKLQEEITVFMSRLMSGALSRAQTQEVRTLIRLADEVESVGDYCKRLVNCRTRFIRAGAVLCESAQADARIYLDQSIAFYDDILKKAQNDETGWMPEIDARMKSLAERANEIRDEHQRRIAQQECSPTGGIFFSDMIVAMRRIRNHSYNMAEAFLGQK